jgi:hypothetical protein
MTDLLNQILENTTMTAVPNPVAPQQATPTIPAPKKAYVPVTKASLLNLLNNKTIQMHVVGRALVVLFKQQTASERVENTTKLTNNVGFTQADAYRGSMTAKSYIKNNTLQDWQVSMWMKPNSKGEPRILKYWRQLDNAAKERAK